MDIISRLTEGWWVCYQTFSKTDHIFLCDHCHHLSTIKITQWACTLWIQYSVSTPNFVKVQVKELGTCLPEAYLQSKIGNFSIAFDSRLIMVANKKIHDHTPEGNTSNSKHGHSLLSFMNLASSKVKTALEKPNTFKRNINHRRFLQKQFRSMVKSPEKHHRKRPMFSRENVDSTSFDCNLRTFPPPLGHNYLQFDVLDTPNYSTPIRYDQTRYNVQRQIQTQSERGHITNVSDCMYQRQGSSSVPDFTLEEDFLTGEELTQAIELKDLFSIPETDLTQYFICDKEFSSGFCCTEGALGKENYLYRGLQEDLLVFWLLTALYATSACLL